MVDQAGAVGPAVAVASAYVERVIGTSWRERLNHMIVFNERILYGTSKPLWNINHRNRSRASTGPAAGVWPDRLDTGAGRLHRRNEGRAALSNPTTVVYRRKRCLFR
jgi:hypothetical protein